VGMCVPDSSASDEAPRAVAVARAVDDSVRVVRIEVRLSSDEGAAPIVRELVFGRRDPLRERWRSVGLAIATLVGEGERAIDEAREEAPPSEPEPEPPPAEAAPPEPAPPEPAPTESAPPEPEPPVVAPEPRAEREAEPEPDEPEEPEVPRVPFEHRSLFIGVGGVTGPGFGAGAWRLGSTLRGAWQAPGGLSLGASFGYAWRASSRDFTAEWLSLAAGVGYRLDASDALSFGVMLLGGAQRARFEVLAAGQERWAALWNPLGGVVPAPRWRATAGFGAWAAIGGGTLGRSSRLYVAPGRDPIEAGAFEAGFAVGLGWWPE
jgi:hypothetical protein